MILAAPACEADAFIGTIDFEDNENISLRLDQREEACKRSIDL